MLIALEGVDGAGTSTQCTLLARALEQRGLSVHTTREPSDNPVGKLIRQALPADATRRFDEPTMALLFAADRLDHLAHEIAPALERGAYVITDRYLLSSLVYQAELLGEGWVSEINARARHADLTLLLDVDASVARSRRAQRGGAAERYDDDALQERLVARYRTLSARIPRCVRIDGSASPKDVTSAILSHISF